MSEMIERVACSIMDCATSPHFRAVWADQPEDVKVYWLVAARAAIAAMREPTADMIDVGRDVGPDAPYGVDETYKRWQAMIDEAMKDQ